MITKEYQLAELAEARRLQGELAKLHIPSPVMSWKYEIKDASGEVTEKGIGKANSFTRNALNLLAANIGLCAANIVSTSSFADGTVNVKTTAGTMQSSGGTYTEFYFGRYGLNNNNNAEVYIGTDATAESLDSYALPAYACSTTATSGFNATTRVLTTILVGTYTNDTGNALSITESGIRMRFDPSNYVLMVRDVFPPISLPDGATMTWTYAIDVSYPNP
jgi:hypothetical protein